MHAEYFAGIGKYDYVSVAFPAANNKRTFAVTGLRFAVDDIMNTLFLVEPDGSINYNNIQAFSSADYAFLFSFAQKFKEIFKQEYQFRRECKGDSSQCRKICKGLGFWFGCRSADHPKQMEIWNCRHEISRPHLMPGHSILQKEKKKFYT